MRALGHIKEIKDENLRELYLSKILTLRKLIVIEPPKPSFYAVLAGDRMQILGKGFFNEYCKLMGDQFREASKPLKEMYVLSEKFIDKPFRHHGGFNYYLLFLQILIALALSQPSGAFLLNFSLISKASVTFFSCS